MSDKSAIDDRIDRLIHAREPAEVMQAYRDWAASYDDDLDAHGYVAPAIGAALLSAALDRRSVVYDAGCGTGKVGALLAAAGFTALHGGDFSADMLQRARAAGSYAGLRLADYSQTLSMADASYDGVISIGVYSDRFGDVFLSELMRILKPDGVMVLSCRERYFVDIHRTLGAWHRSRSIVESRVQLDDYITGQRALAYYVTLRKSASS